MPMPWKRSKKLSQPCGADPREACAWHTDRGVVPGRDAGRPEEQAHLSLGQEGLPSPRHARSTDRIDLLVRCGLPRTRDWRRPRAAGLQQRSHAAPSRRDRNQGHLGCPRDRPARSSRLAWHENAEGPKQHVVDATAAARTRTQRPRKHLAVHATDPYAGHAPLLARIKTCVRIYSILETEHVSILENRIFMPCTHHNTPAQ